MHGVLVICRLTGRLDMTIAVDRDVKPQMKQINKSSSSLVTQARLCFRIVSHGSSLLAY